MTKGFVLAILAIAGPALVSACSGSLAPADGQPPLYGTDPITGTFVHSNPPPCNGPAQLANTPCPTIVDPYARNETTRGGADGGGLSD